MPTFEQFGFIKEYYINRKFIGVIRIPEKDREKTGFDGRKDEVTESVIITDNKKKIKAGTQVMTIIYPLNGKWNRD